MSEADEYGPGGMYADGPNTDIRVEPKKSVMTKVDVQEIAERPVINPEIIDTELEGITDQEWVAVLTIDERDALVALACKALADA